MLASRDGHTLLFSAAGPYAVIHLLHDSLPYDRKRDLVPISQAVDDFLAIASAPGLGAATLADLKRLAAAAPG